MILMDRGGYSSRDMSFERFSADPGVPRCEGQGREAPDSRRRAPSHASWPGEPRRVGEGRLLRKYASEQPGASRERDAEVEVNSVYDGERQLIRSRGTPQSRFLRTPSRWERERSPSTGLGGHERAREGRSRGRTPRREDEMTGRHESRRSRKRSCSSSDSRDPGESHPSNSKQPKYRDTTDAILDKFLCQIYGRQAVDCLLHGVEDRAIRVGAQAAQFSEPEKVLKYFRSVKVGQSRENHELSSKFRNERRSAASFARPGISKPDTTKITCFNCDQLGHPSFKCDKPAAKCTTCDRLGHLTTHCYRNKTNKRREGDLNNGKNSNEKQVAQLSLAAELTAKYMLSIKVNGNVVDCHLDLGSQCSLIKLSKAREFNLDVVVPEDLPTLRGIGSNLTYPVGMTTVCVEVQNIKQTINMYVVDDCIISQSVLLGHSFTEKSDIIITKTPTAVIFKQIPCTKVHLVTNKNIDIQPNTLRAVQVLAEPEIDVRVYVNGSVRGPEGNEYFLLPGEYEIKSGRSALLIYNASSNVVTLKKGTLLARVYPKGTDKGNPELVLDSCKVSFCETQKDDDFNHGAVLDDTVSITSGKELIDMRDEAREKIIEKQIKDQEKFNSRRKPAKRYSEGDLVRVERQYPHDGQSQKLVMKFQGPYRVLKALPNDRYVIEDTPLSRKNNRRYEAIVAVDKMQPWLHFNRDLESSCDENNSDSD
ncbi:hypothetical protein SFRURICE_011051 [Spodoptera frugiperda]|nr:hypothetical protein SFRURICE_011051 [Spodoptera frugiperda]